MNENKSDIQPDKKSPPDRGESIGLVEPMVISETSRHRGALQELAFDLGIKAAGFRRSLPPGISAALAGMVRAMNCYYSNLIEGHDTHPLDIERALHGDYSADARKRSLQLEAQAHITLQKSIDAGIYKGRAAAAETIADMHRRFCELLPEELLRIRNEKTGREERVVPGALRTHDVAVGAHIAISAGAVPRFLRRFEEVYSAQGRSEAVLAAAAAHHRLLWIHPFLDGNGRVARLMSHAMLLDALETGGLWSIARGFARRAGEYKAHLANCDQPRRNDLDGRGHLSEEALAEFTRFFLESCLDQVAFMESLMQPDRLRARILLWAEEEARAGALPPQAGAVLEAILYRGELPRGEIAALLNVTDRHARRIVAALAERKVLASATPKSPLMLAFPAQLAGRWMPGLFPEKTI